MNAMMPVVLKPLGEALTMLPSGDGRRAGPAFGLGRHVPLPAELLVARRIVIERFDALCDDAAMLVRTRRDVVRVIPGLADLVRRVRQMAA